MLRKPAIQIVLSLWCVATFAAQPRAQEVRSGPPAEIRALVDAFLKALDGDAATWEAMAKERFSADHLKNTTAADRKELFDKIRKDFGKVTFERAVREGPDAPLRATGQRIDRRDRPHHPGDRQRESAADLECPRGHER